MQSSFNRRHAMIGATATAATVALSALPMHPSHAAALADASVGATLTERTRAFLATLDAGQLKAATFDWNGSTWRNWNYFGVGGFIKPGLRLEQMSAPQKAATWDMLATVLSPAGLEKAKTVMLLQDILVSQGNGVGERSSERYSLSVHGEPASAGAWGLRLEGHHLTFSVSVRDGRIVSVTPTSFSASPNRVTSGKHAGLVTLKAEEALARRLHADLAPALKAKAQLSDRHLFNILSAAGSERANAKKAGLAAADMTASQRDLLWQLIDIWAGEHLVPSLAETQKARAREGDQAAVHFAWYGPNTPETSLGYRIIADSFVIELGCVDGAAQHIHTITHDLANVLGRVG
jgi:Protein of unknown function (DUF3500)